MVYDFSAEKHDWDVTLRHSHNLLMSGQAVEPNDVKGLSASLLTGAMLLSFCTIESYLNSIAFVMDKKYEGFRYEEYKELPRFWEKLEKICITLSLEMDKSSGIFQTIKRMQNWRNSLVHSTPFRTELERIVDPSNPQKFHQKSRYMEYSDSISVENAKKFYSAAYDFIRLVKEKSGLDPRAEVIYSPCE